MIKNKILWILVLTFVTSLSFADPANQYRFILHNETTNSNLIYQSSGGWGSANLIAYDPLISTGDKGKYVIQGYPSAGTKYFQVVYRSQSKSDPDTVAECVMDFEVDATGKVFLTQTYDHSIDHSDPAGNTYIHCERAGSEDIVVRDAN